MATPEETAKWLSLAQKGDEKAFEALVLSYEKVVYHVALRMMGNAEDAMDLSQEAWIKIYHAIGQFDGKCAFSTWIYRITTNVCIDALRKKKNKDTISMEEAADSEDGFGLQIADTSATPEERYLKRERCQELLSAMERMPPQHKAILLLRDLKDWSYEEIGTILDLNPGTVKSRLYRARENLRKEILKLREQI